MEFHSSMIELHRRVNPKEVIVGWYATGNAITQHSVLIHEFYGRETDVPVHVTINTDLAAPDMAIRAYVSSPLGIPQNPTGTVFTPVNVDVAYVEAERVGGVWSDLSMLFSPSGPPAELTRRC
jgi:translation initiation factor 3 subunit F